MDKKIRTITVTQFDYIIRNFNDEALDIEGHPNNFSEFDQDGNILKEMKYNRFGEFEEMLRYGYDEKGNLIHESLIAYFIPFRSPRMNDLHEKDKSIKFAIELWSEIISTMKPKLIICLGDDVFKNVKKLFPVVSAQFSTKLGWGEITADVYKYENDCRIIKLPHLSTFKIFSRKECEPYIDKLLTEATKDW